jgi:hypothetical protein
MYFYKLKPTRAKTFLKKTLPNPQGIHSILLPLTVKGVFFKFGVEVSAGESIEIAPLV